MIYSIVGTEQKKRGQALSVLAKQGTASVHVYSEHIALLKPLVEAQSLFGDRVVALLEQTMDVASSREVVVELLPEMKDSANVFIIDEPFADANRVKKLEKYAEKVFDCREPKEEGVSPFPLCKAFARRDKKTAWAEWMKIKDTESGEAIHGALWWQMKMVWEDTLSGRPTKFSKDECQEISRRIIRASLDAHRGKKDLKVELESIILSV